MTTTTDDLHPPHTPQKSLYKQVISVFYFFNQTSAIIIVIITKIPTFKCM